MSNPLVSITMGTHNRPVWLHDAIRSVYAQQYQNWEIILVRDGGKPVDVDMYDDRLKFIDRDENKGFAYSLNEAIHYAQGEYIAYLGDDDRMYPHHLKTLVEAIEGTDYGVVYSDLYKCHCRVEGDKRIPLNKTNDISRDFDRTMLIHTNHTLGGAMLHRKDLLELTGMYRPECKVYIDWDMVRRLCFFTDFLHIPKITGEFWAPVNQEERISVKQRKNKADFDDSVNDIMWRVPAPPWSHIKNINDYPRSKLLFDNFYHIANKMNGHTPSISARLYNYLGHHFKNTNWMKTKEAKSWYQSGSFVKALEIIKEVNAVMPTTETLAIEADCMTAIGEPTAAKEIHDIITEIVKGSVYWDEAWKGM